MKRTLLIAIIIVGVFVAVYLMTRKEAVVTNEVSQPPKTQVQIGDTMIDVEVADDFDKMNLGLGGRDSLDENAGMLFVYESKQPVVFWMKGMRFPLDIIWIADGRVIQINSDVPIEPEVSDSELKLYTSSQPVEYVLEVNAGFAQRKNINVGDSFIFQMQSYP